MNSENDVRKLIFGWMGDTWAVDRVEFATGRGSKAGFADTVYSFEGQRGLLEFKYMNSLPAVGRTERIGLTRDQYDFLRRHERHAGACFIVLGVGGGAVFAYRGGNRRLERLLEPLTGAEIRALGVRINGASDFKLLLRN